MMRLLHRAEKLRDPKLNPDGYRSVQAVNAENAFYEQRNRAMRVASTSPDPTAMLVIDEADRLKMAGLEQVRSIFDRGYWLGFDRDAGHRKASRALSAVLLTHWIRP
jgi:hypothetical protein